MVGGPSFPLGGVNCAHTLKIRRALTYLDVRIYIVYLLDLPASSAGVLV
jgi:hypothetical protein